MTERFPTHAPGLPEPGRWLTVAVPALVYPVMLLLIVVWYDAWYFLKNKEGGIEWIAIAILLVGVGYGVLTLAKYRAALPKKWLVPWFAIATLGMFVFAGEEMSWGQHLGFWSGIWSWSTSSSLGRIDTETTPPPGCRCGVPDWVMW